jgi:predicted ATP-grasp superfamily ATP-dependent carboligase
MSNLSIKLRNPENPYAVLIGLDSMQGIQAARILASHKIPVIAIASNPNHHACRTNVCEHVLIASNREEILQTLAAIGPQLDQKAVLFPCEDSKVLTVSRYRERLEPWYHVVLPPVDVVEMLMDKMTFYTYAAENGLAIPKTLFLHSREDAEEAGQILTFPCAMKPPYRTSAWTSHTSLKAFKVESPQELLALYDEYHSFAEALIVQKWIEGGETELYSCNCYFDANNEPAVTFIARKLRQWPPKIGQSSLGEECRNDVVLEESLRLFRSVDYRGLGYVEIKRDVPTDEYYIVEPNIGRPTGRSAIAEAGGVALLYTMYCEAVGYPLPANRTQTYQGVKWIHIRRDMQATLSGWLHGELTLRDWLRSVRGRKRYALLSLRDPMPFVSDLVTLVRLLLSSTERKKRGL